MSILIIVVFLKGGIMFLCPIYLAITTKEINKRIHCAAPLAVSTYGFHALTFLYLYIHESLQCFLSMVKL